MTREEAINFLKGYLDEEVYTEKCRNAHEMAINALEKVPKTEWIPVSERLPEEGQRVFVTQTLDEKTIVYCTSFPFDRIKEEYIIAWMPLPKPYSEVDLVKSLVKSIPLDKIKQAKEEIRKLDDINPDYPMDRTIHVSRNEVLEILDKLIESEEK